MHATSLPHTFSSTWHLFRPSPSLNIHVGPPPPPPPSPNSWIRHWPSSGVGPRVCWFQVSLFHGLFIESGKGVQGLSLVVSGVATVGPGRASAYQPSMLRSIGCHHSPISEQSVIIVSMVIKFHNFGRHALLLALIGQPGNLQQIEFISSTVTLITGTKTKLSLPPPWRRRM